MSDYEDEMDVDAPAAQSSIQFSSNSNEKGKRSAANLPVELQDTLPWYESSCLHTVQFTEIRSGWKSIDQTLSTTFRVIRTS